MTEFFSLPFKSYISPPIITPWQQLMFPLPGPLKTLVSFCSFWFDCSQEHQYSAKPGFYSQKVSIKILGSPSRQRISLSPFFEHSKSVFQLYIKKKKLETYIATHDSATAEFAAEVHLLDEYTCVLLQDEFWLFKAIVLRPSSFPPEEMN